MQSRAAPQEEGKDPVVFSRMNHYKGLPLKLLQLFVLFVALSVAFSAVSLSIFRYFGVQNVVTTMKSTIQPCFEEPSSFEKWIRPPSDLMHSMTDAELFWRAAFIPRRKGYPFPRVPKIAFMFLTKGPLPLAPLWERFLKGHEGRYSIYVHSFPTFQAEFRSSSPFYKRQIPSQIAEWGRMSMCDAERRLLANALLDLSNEWFVLLSESCIPIYSFSLIYHYLMGSKYSFVGAFDDPGPFGRGRYNLNMTPIVKITQWRKGSQWFEVNRKLAVSIVEDTKFHPIFEEFCRPACYVDEHYFPTMLTIQAGHLLANRSVTWVDWSRGGPHPATFGRADIKEEFFKRIREGHRCSFNDRNSTLCYLFARKFAPSTLEPLLQLGVDVLGF